MLIKTRFDITTLRKVGFPGGWDYKNLPVNVVDPLLSLGQKDPLEKGMATHSSILAWIIPWTEEPGGLQSMETQEVNTTEAT